MYKINGKQMTTNEALNAIRDEDVKLTRFEMELPNDRHDPKRYTNEGFDIPKEVIKEISVAMDRTNASYARVSYEDCGTLAGKTVLITIREGKEPWLEKILRKFNLIT